MAEPIGYGFQPEFGKPGYLSMAPNIYRLANFTASVSLVRDTVTLVTGPTGAKGLILLLGNIVRSGNAIAERQCLTDVYSDSGGTVLIAQSRALCREEAAVAAGTLLMDIAYEVHVKCDSSSRVWLKFYDDAGNQGTASYAIMGYYA